ncbi:MAG: hypothetical protein IKX91_04065 [Firmicutes bacterium]|nr:hypothetical protein [Bacillota bacterium]
MYYWFDKGDGIPIETYSGRYRTNHNMPGAQFGGGTVPFHVFFNGGTNYKNDPYGFWSINDITFPEPDNWDVIRIESYGDLLGHRFDRYSVFGDYELYRTY